MLYKVLILFIFQISVVNGAGTDVTLKWQAPITDIDGSCLGPDDTCISDLKDYFILRDTKPEMDVNSPLIGIVGASFLTYKDYVSEGDTFYYAVRARDTSGKASSLSNIVKYPPNPEDIVKVPESPTTLRLIGN